MLRGLEARFVNFYVLPARVLDALLDSVVGTMPVQCRHTTSQGSTEKRGALWIRTRYAIRFVPSCRAILLISLLPSARPNGNSVENVRSWITSIDFSLSQNSSFVRNQRPFDSCLEKHVYLKISTLDTIEVKTKNFKIKKKKDSSIQEFNYLNLSMYTYVGGNEGLIGEIYGIQG